MMKAAYEGWRIGPVIRGIRKNQHITVNALSEATGLSTSTINQIEQGGRNLSMNSLFLFMEALGCDANTLLDIEMKQSDSSVDCRLAKLSKEKKEYLLKSFMYMIDQAETTIS